MHELLACDPSFRTPISLECFAPGHALVSGFLLRKLSAILPPVRPADAMQVGWDLPQEDEFALLNLGIGSPYETIFFPNRRPIRPEFLNVIDVSTKQIKIWQSGLRRFLQQVTFRSQRENNRQAGAIRVVVKSPPHTARLGILRELFPAAQFIHIVRHPHNIFASTMRLWHALYETQGFQKPKFGALPDGHPSVEDYVLDTMDMLYRDFAVQIAGLRPEQFCQVRYEDLVAAPIAEMSRIYAELDLGSFETIRPLLEAYRETYETYKPNDHRISPDQVAKVDRRWYWYFEQYGYELSTPTQAHQRPSTN
jgi:hypothetical protein